MARWVFGVLIFLLVLLGGVLLVALLLWWLRGRRTEETAPEQAIELELAPTPGTAEAPDAVRLATVPAGSAEAPAPEEEWPVRPQPDDLKLIEGIGPKIAGVLQAAGIETFGRLASVDADHLRQILGQADARLLRLADPATWPEQAQLAAAGEWEALRALQAGLRAGRKPS